MMTRLTPFLTTPLAEQIGWTLIHFVWQGAAVASVLGIALRLLQHRSATARYAAGCLALTAIVVFPLVTAFSISGANRDVKRDVHGEGDLTVARGLSPSAATHPAMVESPRSIDITADAMPVVLNESVVAAAPSASVLDGGDFRGAESIRVFLQPYLPWLVLSWLVGVVFYSLRLLSTWRRIQTYRTTGVRVVSEPLLSAAQQLRKRIGIIRLVQVLESTAVEVPMVIGWLRPVILLPISATTGLSFEQLNAIIAHELAHIQRWDYPINLLQSVVETVLFYHPGVWWVSSKIRQEREHCCDDVACRVCGNPVSYARALIEMEELRQPETLVLAANGGQLMGRVRRLIAPNSATDGSVRGIAAVVVLLMTTMVVVGIQLAARADEVIEEPQADLTPAFIADQIEATMEQFAAVDYTAETTAIVNTNAYSPGKEPIRVEGKSSYQYRSDGARWFVDEDQFAYRKGSSKVGRPQRFVAGFDGTVHYVLDRFEMIKLGKDDSSNVRLSPKSIFWRAGLTEGWLRGALRSEGAKITADTTDENGRRVVSIVSEWTNREQKWRFEIDILPEHSWLPLHSKVFYEGKLKGEEHITELAETMDGMWYPRHIEWSEVPGPFVSREKKSIRVTSFESRKDFTETDFSVTLPFGIAVVDHRTGLSWYNDPWWQELAPWLKENFDYPAPDMSALRDLQSYCDNKIRGQKAPNIQATEWIVGENPGPLTANGRRTTILFFFGGLAVSPTPEQLVVLKILADRYREQGLEDRGLDVIGVVPDSKTLDMTRQAVKELQVNFPVAVDTPNEEGKGFGTTFAAYGLKGYTGVFVIDSSGIVHVVNPDEVSADANTSPLEQVLNTLTDGAVKIDGHQRVSLNREQYDRAKERWILLATSQPGRARFSGKITATSGQRDQFISVQNDTAAAGIQAEIQLIPMMKMLSGSPFATNAFYDHDRITRTTCAADGTFEVTGLRKGQYQVTVIAEGLARSEHMMILATDDSSEELSLVLNQGDEIIGRVVDSDGKPIRRAVVESTKRHFVSSDIDRHTTAHLPPNQVTKADGQFVFEVLHAGAFTLAASADGYEPVEVHHVSAGAKAVEIVLQKAK